MFSLPYLVELSPLFALQAALTVWMLVDASRRDVEDYWFWVILVFQPLGAWAYFFIHKVKDLGKGTGANWLANLFTHRPSLEELRYRVSESPTFAAHLDLGVRLVEAREYDEAVPHLETVLAREPDHGLALFALADCHRHLDRPAEAIPHLLRLVSQRPNWGDYLAWQVLVEVCQKAGDLAAAVDHARKLAQVAPSLENKCLLARCLMEAGDRREARQVVERGLEEYRFSRHPSRKDRRWVGKTKQLLKEIG